MESTLDSIENIWLSVKQWITCLVDGSSGTIPTQITSLLNDFNLRPLRTRHRNSRGVVWSKPLVGWIKLNVDGSCRANLNTCDGGILQDGHGNFQAAFSKMLEDGTNNGAKIQPLTSGLKIC